MNEIELEYAGFWVRTGAFVIDSILLGLIMAPLLLYIYGWQYFFAKSPIAGPADFLITWIFPAVATVLFWINKQATPGKMAFSARIVDAISGEAASTGQMIGRYFAYLISFIPLGLGFFWIAIDRRKQGWHDKLAGTVVVRKKPAPVKFVKATGQEQYEVG